MTARADVLPPPFQAPRPDQSIGPPCLRCGCTSEYRDGERSCFCDPCVQAGCLREEAAMEEAVRMSQGLSSVLPSLLAAMSSCGNVPAEMPNRPAPAL